MHLTSYQLEADVTMVGDVSESDCNGMGDEVHAALCLCGEAGELANLVKKMAYHNRPYDTTALVDELGDVLWYVARFATAIGVTLEEVADYNLRKLEERHGPVG